MYVNKIYNLINSLHVEKDHNTGFGDILSIATIYNTTKFLPLKLDKSRSTFLL